MITLKPQPQRNMALLEHLMAELEVVRQQNAEMKRLVDQQQLEIKELKANLNQTEQYKSQFLANISHELKTPLNSLLILTELLQENSSGNLTPEQLESLRIAHLSGASLLILISDLLDFARLDAGKTTITKTHFPVWSSLENLVQTIQPEAESKGLGLKFCIDEQVPHLLHSDQSKVNQILGNLLSNAVKFTESGEIHVDLYFLPKGATLLNGDIAPVDYLACAVSDTGVGIPEERWTGIFEGFHQVDNSHTRGFEGAGLGLAISNNLAHMLGGQIQLKSEPDRGSRFVFYVPNTETVKPRQTPIKEKDTVLFPPIETISPRTILIVENDMIHCKYLNDLIKPHGFEVRFGNTGRFALDWSKQNKPLGIIINYQLPDMSGLDLVQFLRNGPQTAHIPVLLLTDEPPHMETAQPALTVRQKPVSPEDMDQFAIDSKGNAAPKNNRLLIVEDDPGSRDILRSILHHSNWVLEWALDGQQAMSKMQNNHYDAMILDLLLPDTNGLDLLDHFEQKRRQIPPLIIYSTVFKDEAIQRRLAQYPHIFVEKLSMPLDILENQFNSYLAKLANTTPPTVPAVMKPTALKPCMPLLSCPPAEPPEDSVARMICPMVPNRKGVILLIDEHIRSSFLLSIKLDAEDYHVIIADNETLAIQKLEQSPQVDLILMDSANPRTDSPVADRIRSDEQYQHIPLLVVSTQDFNQVDPMIIGSDHRSNPNEFSDLITKIEQHLTSNPSTTQTLEFVS